jgi:release factor glutamine methyltransferase
VTAVDVSPGALAVARRNAQRHKVSINFVQIDLLLDAAETGANVLSTLAPVSANFDLIVANLPYIDSAELSSLPVAQHEPRLALDGGPGGLVLVERLLAQAPAVLAPNGTVLLEIGASQGQRAAALAQAAFPRAEVKLHQDFAGLDRVIAVETIQVLA